MGDTMVTGRMSEQKKLRGMRVLKREGLNASQAVNLMFDRLIEGGSADFLVGDVGTCGTNRWNDAISFVDGLSQARVTRFDTMSKAEIKRERLATKGLL